MNEYRIILERRYPIPGGEGTEVQHDHMTATSAQEVADQMRKEWPARDGWYIRAISQVVRDWH